MSTTINHTQRTHLAASRAIARRELAQPWVHHGVASERVHRAEQAYTAELAHSEHHARLRTAADAGGAR